MGGEKRGRGNDGSEKETERTMINSGGWFDRERDEERKVVWNIYVGGRTRVDSIGQRRGRGEDYRG